MAKFATALCFLALVACGTQDSIFSAMTSQVTDTLTSVVSDVQKQELGIQNGIDSAINAVATFEDQINSVAQDVINENEEIVTGLIASATGDATSCMSRSIDFKEIVLGYASNAIACAQSALAKLLSKCTAVLNVFQNYMKIFDDLAKKNTLCSSNILTFAACMTLAWASVMNEIPNIWAALLSEVTALGIEFTKFEISLASCGSTAAIMTLTTEAQKSQAEMAKCVIELK